jgi:hypothetical protein
VFRGLVLAAKPFGSSPRGGMPRAEALGCLMSLGTCPAPLSFRPTLQQAVISCTTARCNGEGSGGSPSHPNNR